MEIPEFQTDVEWEDWIRLVKEVYWYEGDPLAFENWEDEDSPDRVKSSHFIRLLASMDPCLFQHPVFTLGANGTHQGTVTGDSAQGNLAKMIRESVEDPGKEIKKMRHMAPLAYDIMKFRDHISLNFWDLQGFPILRI